MAFDVVAVTGGYPSATRTGNVTSVPEPTTVLIRPAQTPARAMIAACHHCTPLRYARPTALRRSARTSPARRPGARPPCVERTAPFGEGVPGLVHAAVQPDEPATQDRGGASTDRSGTRPWPLLRLDPVVVGQLR